MLNRELKKTALEIHEKAKNRYNETYDTTMKLCQALYDARRDSLGLIQNIELLVNSIANTPKEFESTFAKISAERASFRSTEEFAKKTQSELVKTGIGGAAGIGTGAAVGGVFPPAPPLVSPPPFPLAPSAAMWVATTFGTASTGTAISALSGAVAQKAALAWLGGGALSAGGGGIVAGKALLALAGPVGWGIAAASTAATGITVGIKNKKIADAAMEEAKKMTIAAAMLKETGAKVDDLREKTVILKDALYAMYRNNTQYLNADYTTLDSSGKIALGTLVNNTLSLAELLNKVVEDTENG